MENSESTCSILKEENSDLKAEIEELEREIMEIQDRFHEEDAKELCQLRSGLASLAKMCRGFHIKLKKAERKGRQLKLQNDELKAFVQRASSTDSSSSSDEKEKENGEKDQVDPVEATSSKGMFTFVAISSAVFVGGSFLLSKFR